MVPLPLIKLIGLAVKQFISKPVASFLKSQMKTKPFLRDRVCIPLGRGYHNFNERCSRLSSLKLRSSSKARIPIRPIDDDKAMEQGAELIGELSIYAIAVLVLISETIKWSNKASAEKAAESLASERAAQFQEEHDQLLRDVARLKEELEGVKKLKSDVEKTIKDVNEAQKSANIPKCKFSDKY